MSTQESGGRKILGVLGGLGPLASAEFVKTVYERSLGAREQDGPALLLYSDPSFPDRTEALLAGDYEHLLARLTAALEWMRDNHAARVVICCLTIHHLLPRLAPELRARVVSLLDVIFAAVLQSRQRHLLLCTTGARRLELFHSHPQWSAASEFLVWPDEADQRVVHEELIYQIKKNRDPAELLPLVAGLAAKYDTTSFVAGCTEFHLLAKRLRDSASQYSHLNCLDPLSLIAEDVAQERL
ncbi:MAG: aspartate/glutamate racemase family protein [Pyrinomonadaceae bacterium]